MKKYLMLAVAMGVLGAPGVSYAMDQDGEGHGGGFRKPHHRFYEETKDMSPEDRKAFMMQKKAEWDAMSDEEKAAKKAEHKAEMEKKKAEWDALSDEEKAAKKAEMKAKHAEHKAQMEEKYNTLSDEEKAKVDAKRAERKAKKEGRHENRKEHHGASGVEQSTGAAE